VRSEIGGGGGGGGGGGVHLCFYHDEKGFDIVHVYTMKTTSML